MALYLDTNRNIHDDMDGQALHLLPAGCVPITQEEADVLRAPTPEQIKQGILAQIATLEGKTERGVREFILASLEREAVALGAQQGLTAPESIAFAYSQNILYLKAKDADIAIAALRAQL